MFCRKCGKELSEAACFCSNCGTPVNSIEHLDILPSAADETLRPGHAAPEFDVGPAQESDVGPAPESEIPPAQESEMIPPLPGETNAPTPTETAPIQDLIIRKKRISVTGGRLLVDGTYYRKTDRRFKKKKGQIGVPLSLVKNVSICRTPCFRKIIASFLLFVIFTAGAAISGCFGWQNWQQMNTSYRQERIDELEDALEQLSGISYTQLDELDSQIQKTAVRHSLLEQQHAVCRTQRQIEILQTALLDSSFNTQALFTTDFFADAYQQYLEDLLEAFLKDRQIHDWLYPYYAYSMKLGQNKYIEDEMYFYAPPGADSIFSAETENPGKLLQDTYNYDLSQHIYYTGRIYITASDFMNRVLHIPDYVVNGSVFLKAYGGTPDPEAMYVPRWKNADYAEFWRDAPAYLDSPDPFWIYYGLSAEEFNLNWGQLADEKAFYDAYLKFMDAIAPGLGVFDMVSYCAGDDSYGGMYYDITGKEASVTEIVTLYIKDHPDYFEEQEPDLASQSSSYDQQLEIIRKEMDELATQLEGMTVRRNELEALLDSGDTLRVEYDRLMKEVQDHRNLFLHNLIIFSCIFILLSFMAIVSLLVFIRLIKKPKHLMILSLEDGTEAAFSIRFCSKKKLDALLEILPTPPADPHT